MRIELASAIESERLRDRSAALKAEADTFLAAGARNDRDQQAGLLARLTGVGLERMQTWIVVLFAVLVEFGSAFGLFLALLPMRGFPRPAPTAQARPDVIGITPAAVPRPVHRPTRFARAADGQLMIE